MSTSEQPQQTPRSNQDLQHRFHYAAPIETVYEAIATTDGVRGWWTPEAEIATEVGGVSQVRFRGVGWTDFRVDRLDRPHRLEWTCVGQDIPHFTPNDEWVGTTITFELTEIDGGTRLDLTHQGLAALECFEMCDAGWRTHVGEHLKDLVERGERIPSRAGSGTS